MRWVGADESGFSVDPWPTMSSAQFFQSDEEDGDGEMGIWMKCLRADTDRRVILARFAETRYVALGACIFGK